MRKISFLGTFLLTTILMCACAKQTTTVNETVAMEHIHDYVMSSEKKATCTKDGEQIFECSCGEKKTEKIAALGEHSWDEGVVLKESTCVSMGEAMYSCENCDASKKQGIEINAEHNWNDGEFIIEATYEEEGQALYTCLDCGTTKVEVVPKLVKHSWNDGEITKEPTCKEDGEIKYVCVDCEEIKTEIIAKLSDHDWDEGKVISKATCKEKGEIEYCCTFCEEIRKEEIPTSDAHTWNKGEVVKVATCGAVGIAKYTCTTCNKTENRNISATNKHSYNTGSVKVEPTCGCTGTKVYVCSTCGGSKTESIAATGKHIWGTAYIKKSATIQSAGIKEYRCTTCGNTKTENIAKITSTSSVAYSTDKILYIGPMPVYGVVKVGNEYYIPLEILDSDWIDLEGWVDASSSSIYIRPSTYDYEVSCVQLSSKLTNNQIMGPTEVSNTSIYYNGKNISNGCRTLNGFYEMIRVDLLGAKAVGNDFHIEIANESQYTVVYEKDLVGDVINQYKKSTVDATMLSYHDYIVNNVTYDPRVSGARWLTETLSKQITDSYTKAEATYKAKNNISLATKYIICHQYADLYMEMCVRSGIPCEVVTGETSGGGHAWNRTYVDGQWFFVDCTWDDPVGSTSAPIYRTTYYKIDRDLLANSHYWYGSDFPFKEEYDESWNDIDPNNITNKYLFRKYLIAQLTQRKTSFSIKPANSSAYGGAAVVYGRYLFWSMSWSYNSTTKAYDFKVMY